MLKISEQSHIQYLVAFLILLTSFTIKAQVAEKLKQTEEEIRQEMIVISRQLGVTCNECHHIKNFKDNSKKSYQVALKHIKIVELLKLNGMNGVNSEPEASCYTCHKGKLKFQHKEKLNDHNRQDSLFKKPKQDKEELVESSAPSP
ncbi:MAG: photosynthetic reaction center cytochrome c subunit [Bdellovibrionaceae bacterium]|nr:photosynthetic reaction center cytochrome c subunit [Pseudobdellovibrionaceae bacterium]